MREDILKDFKDVSSVERAKASQRFFKTGKGEYGEGDVFIGTVVPDIRFLTKKYYKDMDLSDVEFFLHSEIHEYRLFALLVLVLQFEKGDGEKKKEIFNFYLGNTRYINNWDLVDLSVPNIVGMYLRDTDRKILYTLVRSENLWEVRIAVLATFAFIRSNDYEDILRIAKQLLSHRHDLIHKAVGWMLREVGKRDEAVLVEFLDSNYSVMPRTMLRYAIEKLDGRKKINYMKR
ncbi:MAG: DNA alkylation repair protein [Candidatus Dojkabacteria bacterium]